MSAPENNHPEPIRELEKEIQSLRQHLEKALAENQRLPLLEGDNLSADRAYIKEFIFHRDRELGKKYGVEYAEAFHYIGTQPSRLDEYLRQNGVPLR